MEYTEINNHKDLALRILQLKSERMREEIELKDSFSDLVSSLSPSSLVRHTLSDLVHDKELKMDLATTGMNLGAEFLIDRLLGKNKSLKGYLSSIFVDKIATSLITNNSSKIISIFTNLLAPKQEPEE